MAKKSDKPAKKIVQEANSATNQYGLTPMQWKLVEQYPLSDFNGTKAAIAAGYKGKRPDLYASRTLSKPKVREALQDMMKPHTQFMEISRARVMRAWADMAFGANMKTFGDNPNDGPMKWKQLSTLTDAQVACIESITQSINNKGDVVMGMKLNQRKALEMVTKILGIMEPAKTQESKGAFQKWIENQRDIAEADPDPEDSEE